MVGNLIKEKIGNGNTAIDYRYNEMNQLVRKQTNSDTSTFGYDKRGNLVKETTKNKTLDYVFDGTNHLVSGVNEFDDASEEDNGEDNGDGSFCLDLALQG